MSACSADYAKRLLLAIFCELLRFLNLSLVNIQVVNMDMPINKNMIIELDLYLEENKYY